MASGARRPAVSIAALRWPDALLQVGVVVAVYIAYSAVRALSSDAAAQATANAKDLVAWQKDWGLYWEPTIQEWALKSISVVHAANTIYFWFHLPVLAAFGIWMFLASRESFRFLRNVWVITQVVGVFIYALYPVAPPRLLPGSYGFVDTMDLHSVIKYSSDEAGPLMNQYAAFPSLHFAWSVLIAAGLYQTLPWRPARYAALLFPLASFWSIVATGNHYVADALGGALVVAFAFLAALAVDRLAASRAARKAAAPPAEAVRDPDRPETSQLRERIPVLSRWLDPDSSGAPASRVGRFVAGHSIGPDAERTVLGPSKKIVVIPTYNEAANIRGLLAAVLAHGPDYEALVVDDASPDGTGDIVAALAAHEPRVHLLSRQRKLGLGTAYVAGFQRALELGAGLVFQMDADLSHDPADLPRLAWAAEQADVAVGSRYVRGGYTVGWPWHRRLVSAGMNVACRLLLRTPVRDVTGGFKCWRRHVLEALPLSQVRATGFAFQIEMSYLARQAGFSQVEVPVAFVDRRAGASKMSLAIALEAAALLARLSLAPPRAVVERGR